MTVSPARSLLTGTAAILLALTLEGTAHAAMMTWGTAQAISGDSDVSTNGTLVRAFNFGNGSVAATTVNGTLFEAFGFTVGLTTKTVGDFTLDLSTGFSPTGSATSDTVAPFTGLSASYQTLLGQTVKDSLGSMSLTMAGLTVGKTYEFEWWANRSQASANPSATEAIAGASVTLTANPGTNASVLGQFAIGTFVADTTSQVVDFAGFFDEAMTNGFQLRDITAVPEPGTGIFGLACLGLAALRRRRR